MRLPAFVTAITIAAACQGGSSPVQPDDLASLRVVEGVRYEADTRVMESFPVQLATSVTITNTTSSRVTLRFGDSCVVTLRAYQGGQQVWDQRTLILCAQGEVAAVIEPGRSRVFETRADAAQILGGGLPDGEYQLEAVLEPSGETVRLGAGTVPLAIPR
jgi:hypothetical protein